MGLYRAIHLRRIHTEIHWRNPCSLWTEDILQECFWDFHEGRLWFCEYFDGGPQIVPREDITYEKSLDLLQKEGMYYRDYSHYRNRDRDDDYYRPIDPSAVKNPKQLRIIKAPKDSYLAEDPFYYDGLSYYVVYRNRFYSYNNQFIAREDTLS